MAAVGPRAAGRGQDFRRHCEALADRAESKGESDASAGQMPRPRGKRGAIGRRRAGAQRKLLLRKYEPGAVYSNLIVRDPPAGLRALLARFRVAPDCATRGPRRPRRRARRAVDVVERRRGDADDAGDRSAPRVDAAATPAAEGEEARHQGREEEAPEGAEEGRRAARRRRARRRPTSRARRGAPPTATTVLVLVVVGRRAVLRRALARARGFRGAAAASGRRGARGGARGGRWAAVPAKKKREKRPAASAEARRIGALARDVELDEGDRGPRGQARSGSQILAHRTRRATFCAG